MTDEGLALISAPIGKAKASHKPIALSKGLLCKKFDLLRGYNISPVCS